MALGTRSISETGAGRRCVFALALVAVGGCNCDTSGLVTLPSQLALTPATISLPGVCTQLDSSVSFDNVGKGLLIISGLTLEGSGWTIDPAPLPLLLKSHQTATVVLHTTGGDGTLLVASNDPRSPVVKVPLHSTKNRAPVVKITAPLDGAIVAENTDLTLTGTVSDDSEPPDQLTLQWSSSADGPVSVAPAAPDGTATFDWGATGRMPGTQTVTLKATDACGASSTASVTFCQDASTSYSPFDLQGWHYSGSTTYDLTHGWLQITNTGMAQSGSAFQTSKMVGGDSVDISFQFYCSDGTGADGFALVALDASRFSSYTGADGCGMGFGADAQCSPGTGLPGWAVEVDTYYNAEVDQTQDIHTAFAFDGNLRTEPIWAALPNIRDSKWHDMVVNVNAPHVKVTIDGAVYLDKDVTGKFNFPAYIGFTGSTGYQTDKHLIDELKVTGHACSAQH